MSDTILITGGAGFIGSNFIKYLLKNEDVKIINLDALTYCGNLENLRDVDKHPNYRFVYGSINDDDLVKKTCIEHKITGMVNFAAESHVDRSILKAKPFVDTNISGTLTLLEICRELGIGRYLQISTDEVYGSLGKEGLFTESTPLSPNSPYSASKTSADLLVQAFVHTYNFPGLITRCSNNYGPYQFPEKLIPLMILNALEDKPLPVYGDGMNVRDWIYVNDHCSAIWSVFSKGKIGQVYNVGGNCEMANIEIVKLLLDMLNKPHSLITYVKDRPGNDKRYAIDSTKIETELGWHREMTFESGIENTVKWYLDNSNWSDNVRSGAYLDYYKKQYGN